MKYSIAGCALFLLLQITGANGKEIDGNKARQIAHNWLESKGQSYAVSQLNTVYTAKSAGGINTLYVVAASDNTSWVIVSGDDVVEPVLGYSTSSKFDAGLKCASTRAWINGYSNQIAWQAAHVAGPTEVVKAQWKQLEQKNIKIAERTTSVSPLLTTQWDQNPYYNILCPFDSTASLRTVTGCVATAMAQVMRYWKWPVRGCGSHTYTDAIYGNQSANFGATAYNWSAMPTMLFSNSTAVGELMYHAGVSVNMAYGTERNGGSGAYVNTIESAFTPCAEYALKANFHYKRSLYSLTRFGEGDGSGYDSIAEAAWISAIQSELNARRPVIYSGANDTIGGHCWVCDGYSTGTYFHFNWGWSGMSDGYYSVNRLAPTSLGAGGAGGNFNYDQTVILGIEPDSFSNVAGEIQLAGCLNLSNTPVRFGHSFTLSTHVVNAGTSAFSGDFSARLFDSAGNYVDELNIVSGVNVAAGDTGVLTFSTTGKFNLVTGLYGIKVFSRTSSTADWVQVANNGNLVNFTYLGVYDDTDILINQATVVTPGTIINQNSSIDVRAIVTNWSSGTFDGSFKATLNSVTDGTEQFLIQEFTGQSIDLYGFDTLNFHNSSVTVPHGAYTLQIQHQYSGAGDYYLTSSIMKSNPILIWVDWPAKVTDPNASPEVVFCPNPNEGIFTVGCSNSIIESIQLYSMDGRMVWSNGNIGKQQTQLSLTLPAGIYSAVVKTENGTATQRVVIQ